MQKQWYTIHTFSGHENKVLTSILRQSEARSMKDKIFDIRIPMETEVRTRAGKRQDVQKKVLPGYVLIQMVLDEDTWHLVRSTTGVLGFVSSGNKPVPMKDKEIQFLLQSEEAAAQRPKVEWEKNEVVRVVTGPFSGLSGKIDDINLDKEKVRVLISIFGRETPVELDYQQIEKG